MGFTPKDFAAGGLSIKDAKFDCADCKSVGVDVNECLKGGYTAAEIKAGEGCEDEARTTRTTTATQI